MIENVTKRNWATQSIQTMEKSSQRTTYSVQFYCRESKANKNGLAPIEASIIINGKRVFINLPRKEYPKRFKKNERDILYYCDEVRRQFGEIQTEMMRNGIPLTANSIREYFRSGGVKPYTVSDLWEEYLSLLRKRIGSSMTEMTYAKYESARNTFYGYIDKEKELSGLRPSDVLGLFYDLQGKYKESSLCSIMTKIKTVMKYGRDNGRISVNLFQGIRYGKGRNEIEYLTEDEIARLTRRHFDIERLERVRDLAVFQIASGMSYIDTQKLRREDIHFEEDGTCYVYKKRQKTKVEYTAVVFPEGVEILRKYDYKLPSISNQKGNAFLKEIQTLCGIEKTLHFHLFRKTYGTRLLNRGVRLEVVSRCLGHSSTQITQQAYSRLLNKTVIDEVKKVF